MISGFLLHQVYAGTNKFLSIRVLISPISSKNIYVDSFYLYFFVEKHNGVVHMSVKPAKWSRQIILTGNAAPSLKVLNSVVLCSLRPNKDRFY